MRPTGGWTGAGSPDTMRGVFRPSPRQGAGHAILAPARYGPCVQGAGVHHNPSPGPAGEKFVYGHVWVTLAWLARHPTWGVVALPLRALLYVRAKDVPALAKHYPWEFRTKLELAAEL